MPIQRTLVPEWRDEQADSRYPFSDDSTLTSSDGIILEKNMIVDAVVYAIGKTAPMYLKSISYDYSKIIISIEDTFQEAKITGEMDPALGVMSMPLFNDIGSPAGLLIFNEEGLARFKNWKIGVTEFGKNAEFVASVVVPVPGNVVSGFILPDGSVVTGNIWLYGDRGVVLRSQPCIRIDVIGEPLFKRELCDLPEENIASFKTPNFLKTINGMPADDYGNFELSVNTELANDTILRIYADKSDNKIMVELVGQNTEGST